MRAAFYDAVQAVGLPIAGRFLSEKISTISKLHIFLLMGDEDRTARSQEIDAVLSFFTRVASDEETALIFKGLRRLYLISRLHSPVIRSKIERSVAVTISHGSVPIEDVLACVFAQSFAASLCFQGFSQEMSEQLIHKALRKMRLPEVYFS